MIRKYFIYLFFILLTSSLFCQSIQFFREKIVMEISESDCHLKGIYYLKNETDKPTTKNLFYPFIINERLPYPDSVKVIDFVSNETIDFLDSKKGVYFTVHIPKLSIKIFQVDYYQKTLLNEMEYILTTTKFWGKPFDIAEYEIIIPANYKIKYLSMDFTDKKVENNKHILYLMKRNFMPEKNFFVKWEE